MLKIAIPSYNAEKYIGSCISSLKRQSFENFEAVIVSDASTDSTVEKAYEEIENDSRFRVISSNQNLGQLSSITLATQELNPNPEDIIVNIDGDDALNLTIALEIVTSTYDRTGCLMTYGSYKTQSGHVTSTNIGKRYPQSVINKNLYRKSEWLASHLRTYKYHLWKCIDDNDLRDSKGNYWRVAGDKAIMYPMLEMAGNRQEAISDRIYFYRNNIATNVHATRRKEQSATAKTIRELKPYSLI